jgi:hypothetical protein
MSLADRLGIGRLIPLPLLGLSILYATCTMPVGDDDAEPMERGNKPPAAAMLCALATARQTPKQGRCSTHDDRCVWEHGIILTNVWALCARLIKVVLSHSLSPNR